MALLDLQNVCASYDGLRALDGVSLAIETGESVALLGANGAGKSTLLKTISGVLAPTSGEIRFDDVLLNGRAPHQIARMGVFSVPEGRRIFPGLTVEENLLTSVGARDYRRQMDEIYGWLPWMAQRRKQLGWALSGGEQQMLSIARALMGKPRLLLLDEPSLGLSPAASNAAFEFIARIHQRGVALLLVEQNAAYALSSTSRALVLEQGRIVMSGASADLRENPLVRKAYLAV